MEKKLYGIELCVVFSSKVNEKITKKEFLSSGKNKKEKKNKAKNITNERYTHNHKFVPPLKTTKTNFRENKFSSKREFRMKIVTEKKGCQFRSVNRSKNTQQRKLH